MGLVALPKKLQNDRSTAHEPVHMAIKAGFGRSIGLKHISPADGYSRQPTQHYISSSGAFQNVFLWLSRGFDLCQTSMLKSLYQPQSRAIFPAIGGALCNIFLHCEEYTVSVLFVVPPFVCWKCPKPVKQLQTEGTACLVNPKHGFEWTHPHTGRLRQILNRPRKSLNPIV